MIDLNQEYVQWVDIINGAIFHLSATSWLNGDKVLM